MGAAGGKGGGGGRGKEIAGFSRLDRQETGGTYSHRRDIQPVRQAGRRAEPVR